MLASRFPVVALAGLAVLAAPLCERLGAQESPDSLIELSLEQLMQLEVSSVSRRDERLFNAPAAVYVLTAQDLRRASVNTLPEALAMVPGLHVAQVNANEWAVGSRGLTGLYGNNLLVLVDGRSVYSRVFGGVYWEEVDIPMSEIQRIEVIRGPGATLWGSNAVNGVINIVTRPAASDEGTAVHAQLGSTRREITASHSLSLGDGGAARIYASYRSVAELKAATGGLGEDGSWIRRVGGRFDWGGGRSTVTVSGDVFDSDFGSLISLPVATPPFAAVGASASRNTGGHVLARVRHSFEGGSSLTLQAYFDRKSRPSTRLDGKEQTLDVEIQHDLSLGERQDLIWGIGYRHVAQEDTAAAYFLFEPTRHEEDVVNVFAQDQISLVSDRFRVTLGTKVERTGYTGWEVQPKISLLVLPSREQTLWASVSRAVRVPTRLDRDARFNVAIFPVTSDQLAYVTLRGGDVRAERLTAYEVGYRLNPIPRLTLDLSGFVNRYEDLIVFGSDAPEFTPTPPPGYFTIRLPVVNGGEGSVIGGEAIVRVEPLTGWVLEGSYSHMNDHLRLKDGVPEAATGLAQGRAPRHQVRFHSTATLLSELEVDVAVRYVSALNGLDIDGGTAMDAKVSWAVSRFVDVAVGGRNMFAGERRWFVPEFGTSFASLIPPSFSTSLSVRF